jgi:TIR domain/Pentapeptide repeats (8 copies)
VELDLNGANLARADLGGANLAEAKLGEANLSRSFLTGADLNGANLTGADLIGAVVAGANLKEANFHEATLDETIFSDLDLSSCKGLETCIHRGPSTVDIRTLQRSGPLPLAFLRGVGLPNNFIEYLPSLLNQPIQFYSCFISYSSKDDEFVHRLHADLQDKGVRCWFAPEDLKIGAKILDTLVEAIQLRDKVLLVLSETSIASEWVEDEVTKAFAEKRRRGGITVLFPIRLDDAVFASNEPWTNKLRDNRHIAAHRRWEYANTV